MPTVFNEIKQTAVQIPSGSTTSNPWVMGGYSRMSLFVPVIASGVLAFNAAPSGSPTAGGMPGTDGPYQTVVNNLGVTISATTPGSTGGVVVDSNFFDWAKGMSGPIRISAATAQTAVATFWVHLKS